MTALSIVLALLRAIPSLKEWFDDLIAAYIASQLASMREKNKEAIKDAFDKQDQRPIEDALKSPHKGKPSGNPGSEYRDKLPGVE